MFIEDKYWEYASAQIERANREKRKYNGWKDKAERYCFYTGAPDAERHEIFGGNPDRQISIKFGFQVDLCEEKHRELQQNITKWAQEENAKWRHVYERLYLDQLIMDGATEQEALRCWMNLIGRNYIEELMPE